jgi:glycogen operon protein
VNFLAAHDGFTLQDVVSYQTKHNEANLEDDKDGHGENFSANWGVEGPTEEPDILALRQKAKRAMLATLFFSLGTPMLLAGDESGRTQSGNNNAYCQDNEISWFDWDLAGSPENSELEKFVARLIALRKSHPTLHGDRFLHGRNEIAPGLLDIQWFSEKGTPMEPAEWSDPERRLLALRRVGNSAGGNGTIEATLILMNASKEGSTFLIPKPALTWIVELDTNAPDRAVEMMTSESIEVAAGSAILLAARVDA